MPWTSDAVSPRKARLPDDWHARRHATLRRAGWQCQHVDNGIRCTNVATHCDHIERGDDHDLANLQALCAPHHHHKTALEGAAARRRRTRPPVPHPGRLPPQGDLNG